MSKVKLNHYVDTLLSLTDGQTLEEANARTAGFWRLLRQYHQLEHWPEILSLYERRLWARDGHVVATVMSDVSLTAEQLAQISAFVSRKLSAKTVEIRFAERPLGGGLVIEANGWRFDLSLKTQLAALKGRLLESEA